MFNCKLKRDGLVCEYGTEVSSRSTFRCSDIFRIYRDGLVQLCDASGGIMTQFEAGYSYFGDDG